MNVMAIRGGALNSIVRRQLNGLIFKAHPTLIGRNILEGNIASPTKVFDSRIRVFSSNELGSITRQLRKLDKPVVHRIEEELREVDKDEDGRIDAQDLANLLKKHQTLFTDEEIVEFSELFYAGKAGGSMSIVEFIEALDDVAASPNHDAKKHPILNGNCSAEYIYRKSHASYTPADLDIQLTHQKPENWSDRAAFQAVKIVRGIFDTATGWSNDGIATRGQILNRVIFLETVAAVPGMVAAVTRHFRSLRRMERDGGLMHLFLEEANNERMHLLSFIELKNPGMAFRGSVVLSQFGFGTAFFLAYIASPKICHRFVGYIEEEACHTYTKILVAIEEAPLGSELAEWKTEKAPAIARAYWKLGESGTILDLVYAVRADEAEHRDVNHACSDLPALHSGKVVSPFNDPDTKVNHFLRKYVSDIMTRTEDKKTSGGEGNLASS